MARALIVGGGVIRRTLLASVHNIMAPPRPLITAHDKKYRVDDGRV